MREKHIKCPFWRRAKGAPLTIGCEGLVDGSTILQRFDDQADCELQQRVFCASKYENCELYRAILEARYPE